MALRNQEIGARLRELRGQRPQTVVADEIGVAERTYQNWEAGDAKPSYRNLQRLAEYYRVGEDFILTGEGAAPEAPDPFAGHAESRVAELLGAVEKLLHKQNDLLARQSRILERIEGAIEAEDESARRLAADGDAWADAVIARIEAELPAPRTPAPKRTARAKSGSRQD